MSMTKEELAAKAAEEAATAAAAEAKAKAEADALLEAETEEEKAEREAEEARSKIDYEAIAKAETDRANAAEQAAADIAFKLREARRKPKDEEEEEDDEDKPLTRREFLELQSQERQTTKKELQETRALEIARTLTSSEAEARAAVLFWKTRVNPTGNLEDDVSFAVGGLNHKRVVAKNSELARALRGREGVLTDSLGIYRDAPEGTAPKMDAATTASYKRAGFIYDPKDKLWKKKLPNGKFLIKDPRTKQTITS